MDGKGGGKPAQLAAILVRFIITENSPVAELNVVPNSVKLFCCLLL